MAVKQAAEQAAGQGTQPALTKELLQEIGKVALGVLLAAGGVIGTLYAVWHNQEVPEQVEWMFTMSLLILGISGAGLWQKRKNGNGGNGNGGAK